MESYYDQLRGKKVLYKGAYAFVVSVNIEEDRVVLSNWRGVKTTVAKLSDIKLPVKDKK